MTNELVNTFTAGRREWPRYTDIDHDLYIEVPRRQLELVNLAKDQRRILSDSAKQIERSNLAAADTISCELKNQSHLLANKINNFQHSLSSDIRSATDSINSSLDELSHGLSIELSEMRWILAQQQETLEKILTVLVNSRSNEAQQLVRQGVRHLANEEFEEAQERFLKALDFDTTDYQVLMNLGFIEIHNGSSDKAIQYFEKAIRLPENLDSHAIYRGLWAIARLHYAMGDYTKALAFARKALNQLPPSEESIAHDLVTVSGYAALAGDKHQSLQLAKKAVQVAPSLFARVASEPDLIGVREEIWEVLSDMVRIAQEETINTQEETINLISKINKNVKDLKIGFDIHLPDNEVQKNLNRVFELIKRNSYRDYLEANSLLNLIQKDLHELIDKAKSIVKSRIESYNRKISKINDDRKFSSRKRIENLPWWIFGLSIPASLILAMRTCWFVGIERDRSPPAAIGYFLLSILATFAAAAVLYFIIRSAILKKTKQQPAEISEILADIEILKQELNSLSNI